MAVHSEVGVVEDVVAEFCKRNNLSDISHKDIAKFCERNHIRRLMVFGAWTRDVYELEDNDIYVVFKDGYGQGAKSKTSYLRPSGWTAKYIGRGLCASRLDQS